MKIHGIELTNPQYKLLRAVLDKLDPEDVKAGDWFSGTDSGTLMALWGKELVDIGFGLVDIDFGEFRLTEKGVEVVKAIAKESVA